MNKEKVNNPFTDTGIFQYEKNGFDITLCGVVYSVKWNQVKKSTAYKVDLFTTDDICIDIVFADKILTVSEATEGWCQFIEKFTAALLSVNKNWEDEVTLVPFQADETIIYGFITNSLRKFASYLRKKVGISVKVLGMNLNCRTTGLN